VPVTTEEGEGVVVEDTNDALALRIGIEVDATTGFLFFFSATNYEWACIIVIGFRDRGPLNTDTRGGLPTTEDLPMALVVATAARTAPGISQPLPRHWRRREGRIGRRRWKTTAG
jgi:hypothetical protein